MYCAPADLYSFGLSRGALPNPGRLVSSVDTASDTLVLDVHGFDTNDEVQFRAEAGGSLPAPLVAGTTYFAISISDSTFKVAATSGGAAIDLTTAGESIVVIAPLPVLAAIAWASRIIDDMLPVHLIPLEAPYPEIVTMTCAELAAGKLLSLRGAASKPLADMVDVAHKRLERWSKGAPIRGENAPAPANKAVSASASASDPRGWRTWGGIS